jgi:hypothetical protein
MLAAMLKTVLAAIVAVNEVSGSATTTLVSLTDIVLPATTEPDCPEKPE